MPSAVGNHTHRRPPGRLARAWGYTEMSKIVETMDVDAMFASFDIEELDTLEIADGVALPEMGASTIPVACCSSSSSSCC